MIRDAHPTYRPHSAPESHGDATDAGGVTGEAAAERLAALARKAHDAERLLFIAPGVLHAWFPNGAP